MSITTNAPSRPLMPPSAEQILTHPTPRRWWGFLAHGIPNLLVFSLLGGVLYLGHHTGWKMPKMSELRGATTEHVDDWCSDHLVPESQCIECNKDLLPKPKEFGFCRLHGVAECVIEHPELAQLAGEARLPSYDTAKAISFMARSENNSRNTLHKLRVQFISKESATKAGIDVDVVQERPMSDAVTANGELMFDPTHVAHLSPRAAGTVTVVFKTTGDEVQPGDILALVDATLVGQSKSQLLQAVVQVRLKRSNEERLRAAGAAVPAKSIIEAEAALQEVEIAFLSARQALMNLGFDVPDELEHRDAKDIVTDLQLLGIPPHLMSTVKSATKTANLIPVRAPIEGVVVASDVVAGEVVDTTKLLFTVANPQQMWLTLNVRQEDAKYVSRELSVVFRPDDGSPEVTGEVSWISPTIDERTRTLPVRVKIDNSAGTLRDKTFGTGRIVLRDEPKAITVPREAVQSTNDAQFVFVRDRDFLKDGGPKVFHVRQVRIGARDDRYVELLAGVLPGEVIATKGSPVLLAQLLRSNLGAGCGCHEK